LRRALRSAIFRMALSAIALVAGILLANLVVRPRRIL
jgi:hypothetical protein